jgi:hypothetical protein
VLSGRTSGMCSFLVDLSSLPVTLANISLILVHGIYALNSSTGIILFQHIDTA